MKRVRDPITTLFAECTDLRLCRWFQVQNHYFPPNARLAHPLRPYRHQSRKRTRQNREVAPIRILMAPRVTLIINGDGGVGRNGI